MTPCRRSNPKTPCKRVAVGTKKRACAVRWEEIHKEEEDFILIHPEFQTKRVLSDEQQPYKFDKPFYAHFSENLPLSGQEKRYLESRAMKVRFQGGYEPHEEDGTYYFRLVDSLVKCTEKDGQFYFHSVLRFTNEENMNDFIKGLK